MNEFDIGAYAKSLGIVDFSDILIGAPDTVPLDKFLSIIINKTVSLELLLDRNMLSYMSGLCLGNSVNDKKGYVSPQRKLAALLHILRYYGRCHLGDYSKLALLELIMSNQGKFLLEEEINAAKRRFRQEMEAIYNISHHLKPHALKSIAEGTADTIKKEDAFDKWFGISDIPLEYKDFPAWFNPKLYLYWCRAASMIGNINRKTNASGINKLKKYLNLAINSGISPNIDAIWATRVFCGTAYKCKKNFGKDKSLDDATLACLNQAWDFYIISEYVRLSSENMLLPSRHDRYIYLVTGDYDLHETISTCLVFEGDRHEDILFAKIQAWCGKRANDVIAILKNQTPLFGKSRK